MDRQAIAALPFLRFAELSTQEPNGLALLRHQFDGLLVERHEKFSGNPVIRNHAIGEVTARLRDCEAVSRTDGSSSCLGPEA